MNKGTEAIIGIAVVVLFNIISFYVKRRKEREADGTIPVPRPQNKRRMPRMEDLAMEPEESTVTAYDFAVAAKENEEVKPAGQFPEIVSLSPSCDCLEVEELENTSQVDYGDFIRNNGREAIVLNEILMPRNARLGHRG